MTFAYIIDTETTGLKEPELIEYGQLKCYFSIDNFVAEELYSKRYKPSKPIEFSAMATHGITDQDLKNCEINTYFVQPHCDFIIGHNIDFDWKVVGSPGIKRICTLALARSIWPNESHKLLALMYMLKPDKASVWHKSAHGVETDIEMTFHLLGIIIDHLKVTSLEALWEASEAARIPKAMPFGKHINTPISDLPFDYIQWCLRSLTDIDPYLKQALQDRI